VPGASRRSDLIAALFLRFGCFLVCVRQGLASAEAEALGGLIAGGAAGGTPYLGGDFSFEGAGSAGGGGFFSPGLAAGFTPSLLSPGLVGMGGPAGTYAAMAQVRSRSGHAHARAAGVVASVSQGVELFLSCPSLAVCMCVCVWGGGACAVHVRTQA
jgi:hypothetical protein